MRDKDFLIFIHTLKRSFPSSSGVVFHRLLKTLWKTVRELLKTVENLENPRDQLPLISFCSSASSAARFGSEESLLSTARREERMVV